MLKSADWKSVVCKKIKQLSSVFGMILVTLGNIVPKNAKMVFFVHHDSIDLKRFLLNFM